MKPTITDDQIKILATEFGIEWQMIKAVMAIESSGSGFNDDGSLKIKFEGHWFYKLLPERDKYAALHPNICYPSWTEKFTKNQKTEYERFHLAMSINAGIAMKSTSFGLFQIMGINHVLAGFKSVDLFYNAMNSSEVAQLSAFLRFINARGIAHYLKVPYDYRSFARAYNGLGFTKNKYDIKIENEFNKLKNG